MPRINLIRTNQYFYHITTRSNHKDWFSIPLKEVWQISMMAFKKALEQCPAQLAQYVLMANHYHLLIRTENEDIDIFMFWFNKVFSQELRKRSRKVNRMFGSNYKWCLIKNERYLLNVYRYIYQNPLRAGIVNDCRNYPYSTIHEHKLPFKLTKLYVGDFDHLISEAIDNEQINQVKTGLRKSIFKPTFNRKY